MSFGRSLRALVRSNDRRFVELLVDQADLTLESLRLLARYGEQHSRSGGEHQALLEDIKQIERRGDERRRVLIDELRGTFATPFDREDLFALSRTIDDILDAANETAIELSMYRIEPPPRLPELASVLSDGARHIRFAVGELVEHPNVAAEHAVRAKRSENRIDALYHRAVAELFDSGLAMSEMLKCREIYRHLKNSADRIDRAADEISVIVIKRT
jgi:predicted phosphate transport protein (TIGR00153 family)